MRYDKIIFFLIFLVVANCSNDNTTNANNSSSSSFSNSSEDTNLNVVKNRFYHTNGIDILDSENNIAKLHGVSFGNEVWFNDGIPKFHHQKSDYKTAKDMGFNIIRFYLNYATIEDDNNPYTYKDEGWVLPGQRSRALF